MSSTTCYFQCSYDLTTSYCILGSLLASQLRGPGSTLTFVSLQVNLPEGHAARSAGLSQSSSSSTQAFRSVGSYGRASRPPSTAAVSRPISTAAHSVKGNGLSSHSANARRKAHANYGHTSQPSSRKPRAPPPLSCPSRSRHPRPPPLRGLPRPRHPFSHTRATRAPSSPAIGTPPPDPLGLWMSTPPAGPA